MKKLMAVASVLALLIVGTAMLSYAQGPGGPHGGFGGPGAMGIPLHELNLTDTQKAQVKQIMTANKTTMKTVMMQVEQNRLAMLNATANGAYNAATIQQLAAQRAQLEAAMTVNHQAIEHQIYTTVLTADQQAKVEQLRSQQVTRITEHLQKIANGTDTPPAPPSE